MRLRTIAAALLLAAVGTHAADATTYTAISAKQFTYTLGVNTHTGFAGDTYWTSNASTWNSNLSYLGVHTVRDGSPYASFMVTEFNTLYSTYGITVDMVLAPGEVANSVASNFVTQISSTYGAAVFHSIEGPNEVNLNDASYGGCDSVSNTACYATNVMTSIYNAYKSDSRFSSIPIYMLSTGNNYTALNNMTSIVDVGNWHSYCDNGYGTAGCASFPTIQMGVNDLANNIVVGKPTATTEVGYCTNVAGPGGSQDTLGNQWCTTTEAQAADWDLDIWCDAVYLHQERVYIYELGDDNAQNGNVENAFGLFYVNGSPKPQATAIHNMMAIVNDTGTVASPPSISATVSGSGNMVVATARSDGTADLIVWQESGSRSTTVTLPTATSIKVYDPIIGTSAQQTITSGTSVTFTVTDHPIIVRLGTSGGATAPVVTPSASGTIISAPGGANIIDNNGNTWNLVNQGAGLANQISENGTVDPSTQFVTTLEFIGGNMWQYNGTNWYENLGGNTSFVEQANGPTSSTTGTGTGTGGAGGTGGTGGTGTSSAAGVSPDGTILTTTGTTLTDCNGNTWTLTTSSTGNQVSFNGVADTTTSYVQKLELLGCSVLHENVGLNWYIKAGGYGVWTLLPAASYAAPVTLSGVSAPVVTPYIADSPAGAQTRYASVVATGGVLMATGTGVTGNNTSTLTITGTLTQINQVLATLKFIPTTGSTSIALSYGESSGVLTTTASIPVAVH